MASPSEMSVMCRLCLLKDQKQVNIPIFEDRSDNKLLVKISALLPVKVSKEDQLPKKICNGCLDKLNLFYEFRNTSLESEQTLLFWLKDDNLTINALAETIVKEEVEIKEDLDPAQYSFIHEFQEAEEEEAEEPLAKRPRRFAVIKSPISISSDSNNDQHELDTIDVELIENLKYESDRNDNDEDIAKSENESYNDLSSPVPENSAYDQPGPSGLSRSGAETSFMIENDYVEDDIKNEIEVSAIELIDPSKGIKEKEYASVANSSGPDVNRKFQCYTCNAVFKTKRSLECHSISHSDIRPFKCDTCEAKFKRKAEVKRHIKTHSDIYPFKCNTCQARFKLKCNLKVHMSIHSDIYPLTCNTCGARFKHKSNLKSHILKHSDIYPFACDTCKAKFKRKYNLKDHILTHKNFRCNVCATQFKTKKTLKTHLLTHLDIYPFQCDTCKAKFKQKNDFNDHKSTHLDIYPFECNTCQARFKQKGSLKAHMLIHSDIYPFTCNTCGARFRQKSNLKSHILKHSDIHPFACDTCEAKFKRRGAWRNHKLIHSNIYPFECYTCGAKYKQERYLKQHILGHNIVRTS